MDYDSIMTVTVEEAKANLAEIIAKVEAGAEILIARNKECPTVKLVSVPPKASRLVQHPEMAKALVIHDHAALAKPLPPEEWGDLTDR